MPEVIDETIINFINEKEFTTLNEMFIKNRDIITILLNDGSDYLKYLKEKDYTKFKSIVNDENIEDLILFSKKSLELVLPEISCNVLNNDIKSQLIGNILVLENFDALDYLFRNINSHLLDSIFLETLYTYIEDYDDNSRQNLYKSIKNLFPKESENFFNEIKKNYDYFNKLELNEKIVKNLEIKNNKKNKI
jgi:hypothetical protein